MEKWKKIGKKLLFPPVWLIVILTVLTAIFVPLTFILGWDETPVAYGIYVVAFYAVTVLTLYLALVLPKHYRLIRQKIYDTQLGNRYMTDTAFKVRVSLVASLSINLAYSVFHLLSGIVYASFWIGAVAVYYILLSLVRFILLYHIEKRQGEGRAAEYRSYRTAGILMICLNIPLSGIVLNMILTEHTPNTSDVFVIASATYTFYILTVSTVDMIRYHRYNSPVMSASKVIRLTAALVSVLSLETSMLVQFGEGEGGDFRKTMTALTGCGVCVMILAMSVYMIVKANKEIRRLRSEEEQK